MSQYFTVITNVGKTIEAELLLGETIDLIEIAVGTGGGDDFYLRTPEELEEMTELVDERYRATIDNLYLDPLNNNQVIAEIIVPPEVGGWTIREVGIFTDLGFMFAVGMQPKIEKPVLTSGASVEFRDRLVFRPTNVTDINIEVLPYAVATHEYVQEKITEHDLDIAAHPVAFDSRIAAHNADVNANGPAIDAKISAHDALVFAHLPAINAHNTDIDAHVSLRPERGMIISNNLSNPLQNIDFSVGHRWASNLDYNLYLTAPRTKNLQSFVEGIGGGLFSGSAQVGTWYHAFIIRRISDGYLDAGFSLSVTAADIPTGYDAYKRVGSILTNDPGPGIMPFIAYEIAGGAVDYTWATRQNQTGLSQATGRHLLTLLVPPNIFPIAKISASVVQAFYSAGVIFTPTAAPAQTPTATNRDVGAITIGSDGDGGSGRFNVLADNNSQIAYNAFDLSGGQFGVQTLGWLDRLVD